MDWLIEPFRYPFMQTALLGAICVGVTCAVLGVHVGPGTLGVVVSPRVD